MKSPAFQFYVNDWLSSLDITLMSPAEEGALIRLLCYAWQADDCGLPDDDNALAQLSRLGEAWFSGGSKAVRKCFFSKNGRLFNQRLLDERKKQDLWRKKSSEGGKNSGETRKRKRISEGQVEGCLPNGSKGGCEMVATKDEPKGNISSSTSSSSSTSEEKEKDKKEKQFIPSPAEDTGRLRRVSNVLSDDELSQWASESGKTEWIKIAWNEIAYNLPECQSMSLDMHKGAMMIRKREADNNDNKFGKLIRSAIIVLNSNAFCCGENERGWKASATWLLTPKNFTKILNGDYGEFILLDDFSSAAMPEQSVPTPQRYIDPNTGEVKEYIPKD